MALTFTSLDLFSFRNIKERHIDLSEGLTILCGENGAGKTNTIEALRLLSTGSSFRNPKVAELILDGESSARIQAKLEGDGRHLDIDCQISETKRNFYRNGKYISAQDVPDTLMSILFTPDDLSLIKRGAQLRRDEIDSFACQVNKAYRDVFKRYSKSVQQRNQLLKSGNFDSSLLDAWDSSVAIGAATVLSARLRLLQRLAQTIEEIFPQFSRGKSLTVSYETSIDSVTNDWETLISYSKDRWIELFQEAYFNAREEDIHRQQTSIGPHRDDIVFTFDGRLARRFASQGQQRLMVICTKIAELTVAEEICGQRPLLLLDDVMSELDEARREIFSNHLLHNYQTVLTTTNLDYFSRDLLAAAKVVEIDETQE